MQQAADTESSPQPAFNSDSVRRSQPRIVPEVRTVEKKVEVRDARDTRTSSGIRTAGKLQLGGTGGTPFGSRSGGFQSISRRSQKVYQPTASVKTNSAAFDPKVNKEHLKPPKILPLSIPNSDSLSNEKTFEDNKQPAPSDLSFLNPFEDLKPIQLSNPFTPNPLMKLFAITAVTLSPILPTPAAKPIHDPTKLKFPDPPPLPDPFFNPLFPQKKSKIMKALFGDTPGILFGHRKPLGSGA